jgi:serine/threonine protein kinase
MGEHDQLPNAETRVKALSRSELQKLARRDRNAPRLGPYVLQHRLGAGGMAEVFLAFNEGSDVEQQVVIKRILPHYAKEPRYVEMFRREAIVSMGLDHENIVRVYGLVEDEGQIGLVMEFLEGLTLFDLALRSWRQNRSLPLEPLLSIFRHAARALAFAHRHPDENGVMRELVHRDVSPDNLLVTKQGTTKLLDFGVAKPEGENAGLTRTGQIKGKVSYMSPEQVRGEKLDGRSDLFSLGTTFYWLLTGVRPFDRASPLETMEAVVLADIPRPSELNPRVPTDLEIIVLRLLERDRRFRTPNGTELDKQLGQLLARVPRDATSPKWLLQEVLGMPEGPAMPRPEFPAVPSVDWKSGEHTGLMRRDPTKPHKLEGEWADVDTAQFPVFGRLVDPSSNFGEVFTESTLMAVEAPGDVQPDASGIDTAATIPAEGNNSAELAAEALAALASVEAASEDPDTIRVPTDLPRISPVVRPPTRRDVLGARPTIQMPAEASVEPALDVDGRPTLRDMQSAEHISLDVHGSPTLKMRSQENVALDVAIDPLKGGPTLQMASQDAEAIGEAYDDIADVHGRPTMKLQSSEAQAISAEAAGPPTIPVPTGDTIPSHIDTASGPTTVPPEMRAAPQMPAQQMPAQQMPAQQMPAQQMPAQQRPAQQRPAQSRAPSSGPDTIPDVASAAGPMRAEDISVPSSPLVKTTGGGNRFATVFLVGLVAVGLAGAGAWLALSYAKQNEGGTTTSAPGPKPEDPKPQDPKPEVPKPEDPKPEDPKPEDPKPQDPKPEDPKPEDPKPEDPKPGATKPGATKPKPKPKPVAAATVDVQTRAGGGVSWRAPGGKKKLGSGSGTVAAPKDATALNAVDNRRGVTVKVPIINGVADYNAMKTEKLVVRARPWANATLGGEKLGQTPFEPVSLAPGRYKLVLEWEGKTTERTVVARKGGAKIVVAVDMRTLE